ncbi:DUF4405 domain-containing protein [Thermopirellula anaerolimosa]
MNATPNQAPNVPPSQSVAESAPPARPFRFHWQGFASLVLFGLFAAMAVSGTVLYLSPRGRTANWTNWRIWGLGKEDWATLHICVTAAFLVFGLWHLFLNWRMFWGYIRCGILGLPQLRLEMLAAVLVTATIVYGGVRLPRPFDLLAAGRDYFRDYWERQDAAAPVPHAEELPLGQIGRWVGIPGQEIARIVAEAGVSDVSPRMTLQELADRLGVAPKDAFAWLQERVPELQDVSWDRVPTMSPGGGEHGSAEGHPGGGFGGGRGMGGGMGPGMGGGMGFGRGRGWTDERHRTPDASDDR